MRDKRRSARVLDKNVIVATVELAPFGHNIHGKTMVAQTADISATGMRVVVRGDMPVGTELNLRVATTEPPQSFALHGRVLWSRKLDASNSVAGIQLENIPDVRAQAAWERFAGTKAGEPLQSSKPAGPTRRDVMRERGTTW